MEEPQECYYITMEDGGTRTVRRITVLLDSISKLKEAVRVLDFGCLCCAAEYVQ